MAGTITQVGVLRFLMVLIWLSVPVSAYFFMRADQDRYLSQSAAQRLDCEARAEVINRYTRLLSLRASRVPSISNADTRADWQGQFSQVTRGLEAELLNLRSEPPDHYPQTDALLLGLEQQLSDQENAIRDAARHRSAYNMAGGNLDERLREIQMGRDTADYYRSIRAYGIAELIDDEIDLRERELNKQVTERNNRARDMAQSLAAADKLTQEIRERLGQLPAALADDEQVTYQMDLRQRFDEFDLHAEFSRLLGLPEPSGMGNAS